MLKRTGLCNLEENDRRGFYADLGRVEVKWILWSIGDPQSDEEVSLEWTRGSPNNMESQYSFITGSSGSQQ